MLRDIDNLLDKPEANVFVLKTRDRYPGVDESKQVTLQPLSQSRSLHPHLPPASKPTNHHHRHLQQQQQQQHHATAASKSFSLDISLKLTILSLWLPLLRGWNSLPNSIPCLKSFFASPHPHANHNHRRVDPTVSNLLALISNYPLIVF
jgi:hypothetical protein